MFSWILPSIQNSNWRLGDLRKKCHSLPIISLTKILGCCIPTNLSMSTVPVLLWGHGQHYNQIDFTLKVPKLPFFASLYLLMRFPFSGLSLFLEAHPFSQLIFGILRVGKFWMICCPIVNKVLSLTTQISTRGEWIGFYENKILRLAIEQLIILLRRSLL